MFSAQSPTKATVIYSSVSRVPISSFCMSADGLTAGGEIANRPAVWSAAKGLMILEIPSGAKRGRVTSLSADGLTAVGRVGLGSETRAVVWRVTSQVFSTAIDELCVPLISRDGSTLIGDAVRQGGEGKRYVQAFSWTKTGGFKFLPSPFGGGCSTRAFACSNDGLIVVGCLKADLKAQWEWLSKSTLGFKPIVWTDSVPRLLPKARSGENWIPNTCSGDGHTIAGRDGWKTPFVFKSLSNTAQLFPVIPKTHYGGAAPILSADGFKLFENCKTGLDSSSVFELDLASGGIEFIHATIEAGRSSNPISLNQTDILDVSSDNRTILARVFQRGQMQPVSYFLSLSGGPTRFHD